MIEELRLATHQPDDPIIIIRDQQIAIGSLQHIDGAANDFFAMQKSGEKHFPFDRAVFAKLQGNDAIAIFG